MVRLGESGSQGALLGPTRTNLPRSTRPERGSPGLTTSSDTMASCDISCCWKLVITQPYLTAELKREGMSFYFSELLRSNVSIRKIRICLTPHQTIGPSTPVLAALIGSSSPAFQTETSPTTTWRCCRMNPGMIWKQTRCSATEPLPFPKAH